MQHLLVCFFYLIEQNLFCSSFVQIFVTSWTKGVICYCIIWKQLCKISLSISCSFLFGNSYVTFHFQYHDYFFFLLYIKFFYSWKGCILLMLTHWLTAPFLISTVPFVKTFSMRYGPILGVDNFLKIPVLFNRILSPCF